MASKTTKQSLDHARKRNEMTQKRVQSLEKRLPLIKSITQNPKYKDYVLPSFAILEVGFSLVFILFIVPFLLSLLPNFNLPFPDVNLPDINVPKLNLPSIDLPGWLGDIVYWLSKTSPIWIAIGFAIYEIRKKKRQEQNK